MTIAQAFELAVQQRQSGRLAEAEVICRQILAVEPQQPAVLHLRGVIAHQAGRSDLAVEWLSQAGNLSPNDAAIHSNLGEAYRKLGRLKEAIAANRRALQLQPRCAEAHSNLGCALADHGQRDEAVAAYRRALELKADFAGAHYNLGNVLRDQGHMEEAIASYRRAIQLKPDYAEAYGNVGAALDELGRIDEAIGAYRRAIEFKADYPEAHNNLGNALADQGQLDQAVKEYCRALQLRPNYPEAHCNLGSALHRQGRLNEAIAAARRALEFQPDFAEALNNLGNALADRGQLDQAIRAYDRALQLRPKDAEAYSNLGTALDRQGRLDGAIAAYRRALELQPSSTDAHNNLGRALVQQGRTEEAIASLRAALEIDGSLSVVHSNLLLDCHYAADLDAEAIFREHCRWEEVHARPLANGLEPHANDPEPHRRLRIGYVSPDFRLHSVALFLENLLVSHDRGQVEVVCYADLRRADMVSARLRQHAGQWREITGMSDAQAAELIRRDRIDILVDLAGHTDGNRLLVFARQPAPVQVSWLGYCDTTGMKAMDYRFTDAHADPPGATEHLHTEQLVRLPETFACFRPVEDAPLVSPLPALARGHITFASFHTLAKLNDPLLVTWAEILQRVPGSRLMMVAAGLDEGGCRKRLSEFFGRHGIGTDRLEFKACVPLSEYLRLHHEVDVLLDSHPFSGHTVSCHALWMGMPVVTLAGDRHCARMVASVLANVGLPEWIAHTPGQYVEIAAALAADLPRLAALRGNLRERMAASPLMDGPRFARHVEAAYRQMWRTWCAKHSSPPTP